VIREDRELLAELARLNRDMASLCLRMMDGSAGAAEQREYARRLIAAGQRLGQRGEETPLIIDVAATVVDGDVVGSGLLALPGHSVEPYGNRE
jgi:hypothetical protein